MRKIQIAVGILTLTLASFGVAQGTTSSKTTGEHYSQSELKKMASDARTPQQFSALANYYGNQQQTYLQKAAAEKLEWVRRSQYTTSISARYPRPVDSARNLYEYYAYKASEAGALSDKYHQLAQPASPARTQ
jgi:hypothetical protein